ncbi:3-dehydroquinate synthase [Salinisphaera sp.]|uniref:3-dehydroquinate synthase n=1 Tax=Salinisphaera sp. TaxID=1914330 RepID=UPI002D78517A|nr:3-dehydroquinate synthase [Salinisphaera sp.]HET7314876.1 3-dehydroquinate synthase [Salinisphaera sp.]
MIDSPAARSLRVELGSRAYDILIGPGLIGRGASYDGALRGRRVLIITNETVAPHYREPVETALAQSGHEVDTLILADGEVHKTLASIDTIAEHMLSSGYGRDTTVVALGGGVIGDLAGFAAAIYQRGVDFVQVPTTLLAQVDSSVGGKTGVNHPLGKNMIGAFHQPKRVLADVDVLATLPQREFAAGMAEVIKYGLIRDAGFFDWLEAHMADINARDPELVAEVIRRSCANKAEVVVADEREAGERALLNLGHTFGHALEAELGYGAWLHGEAVAAGMCMAADTSKRLGWLNSAQVERIEAVIAAAGLPIAPPEQTSAARILELMRRDKKVTAGTLRLVLLTDIGRAIIHEDLGAALDDTLHHYLAA